jgi:hypothetical protein
MKFTEYWEALTFCEKMTVFRESLYWDLNFGGDDSQEVAMAVLIAGSRWVYLPNDFIESVQAKLDDDFRRGE